MLSRRSPLKPGQPLRSSPLRKRSRKQAKREREWADIPAGAGACEKCLRWAKVRVRHHIGGRGEGKNVRSNALVVCPSCHDAIHASPAKAYADGTMQRRNGPLDLSGKYGGGE